MEMRLEDLGDLAINAIISKLDAKDTVAVSCVSKKLRVSASEESLWLNHCSQDLGLSAPIDPLGKPAPSFKEESSSNVQPPEYAYLLCVEVYQEHLGSVLHMHIYKVELPSANFPEADATLRKGATEVEIKALENILKVKLPLPTRLLYRFCDGQELTEEDVRGTALGGSLGIIGGYCCNDHLVNVCLLPLRQVILETKEITDQLGCDAAMVRKHVRRLQNGIIKLRKEGMIRSINLFPEEPPLCSTAVTNGVQEWVS
ncbi:F-box protein SKIP16 [Vitis vinifera]|uniref:F-box protein SKIP16 n=1 Tax=Vitis vinifera TaxID=29760 RepID=A0A438HW03_VITVI|nr:F-box protein SKIP16 [Vitis vinifera]